MPTRSDYPARTGMQRIIPSWEFRHLGLWAGLRIGGSLLLAACGLSTLALGGQDAKTYGWAAAFFGLAGLALAAGFWELSIARNRPAAR
jgi:hypothetical protein